VISQIAINSVACYRSVCRITYAQSIFPSSCEWN